MHTHTERENRSNEQVDRRLRVRADSLAMGSHPPRPLITRGGGWGGAERRHAPVSRAGFDERSSNLSDIDDVNVRQRLLGVSGQERATCVESGTEDLTG